MPYLRPDREAGEWRDLVGPFDGTHFIYYNRDTSEMMGGLEIEHDAYQYRPDLYEKRDPAKWEDGEVPEGCDAEGYCFFCGATGSGLKRKRYKRIMLFEDDTGFSELISVAAALRGEKDRVLFWLDHYDNADELTLEDAYSFKRGDYE
jgi:hypothetical protein